MVKKVLLIVAAIIVLLAILSLTVFKPWIKAVFYIDHMERDERVSRMQVDKIVETLALKSDMLVADIGAGSGLFSRKFAEKIMPDGKVYAVDINQKLLSHIKNENAKQNINNIVTILADENDPKIPEKVDVIFMADVLHYIDNQEDYIATLCSYLEDNGQLAVISFEQNWPPASNKFTLQDLETWLKAHDFVLKEKHDFVQDEFFAIFIKSASASNP